jgi:hypothetical protein
MSLKKRIERIESSREPRAVPMLTIDTDGTARCAGQVTTREEWEAAYGNLAREERQRTGRRIFRIDFSPHANQPESEE